MKISAYENQCQGEVYRFLRSGITFYMPTDILSIFLGPDSPFTLALGHQLQSSSCFYYRRWEKVIIPPSILTFWVHVITISSLAWECWIIPASSLYGEESSWNNLIDDDDDDELSSRRCHLLLDFFLENFHVRWCCIIFILTYHCASTCKILSSVASFLSAQTLTDHATVWNISDEKEERSISRKLSEYTSQSSEKMICLIVNST